MIELEMVYLVVESCILLAGSCIPEKVTVEMIELEKCHLVCPVLWGLSLAVMELENMSLVGESCIRVNLVFQGLSLGMMDL